MAQPSAVPRTRALHATRSVKDLAVKTEGLTKDLSITIPFAFGSIGQLVAASRPRAAVVALSAVAVFSYFVQQFAPLFEWPDWVANLSLYTLYGMPMTGEINWAGVAGLVGIGAAATVASMAALRRRDIGA
jgi:putative exporter of polyketide antibiotics